MSSESVRVIAQVNSSNGKILKRMGLKYGVDYSTEKGAVKQGRPNSVVFVFKDKNKALMFKLRCTS